MKALFVVGPPGVGKTSMVRELFKMLDPFGAASMTMKPKWTVSQGIYAAAGHYTGGTFDGADTVPYTGAMQALDFLEENLKKWKPKLVLFDGDRFSYSTALERVKGLIPDTRVAHLQATPEMLAARRLERGSKQNPTWLAGRETKARRFVEGFAPKKTFQANQGSPIEIARLLYDWVK